LTEDRFKHPFKNDRGAGSGDPDCIVGLAKRARLKGRDSGDLDRPWPRRRCAIIIE